MHHHIVTGYDGSKMSEAKRSRPLTVAVIGGGAWGTTLSALASAGGQTRLWARESEVVDAIRDEHENRLYLPGI